MFCISTFTNQTVKHPNHQASDLMKIALCSIGSRGDIQPFLVLGEYLSQNGFQVKVSSAKMYQSLASNYELNYVPFEGDYEAIMDNEALKKEMGKNPFTIGRQLKEKVYPVMENSLETFYELLQWADLVIYHPKTLIDSIAYEMSHKLMKAYVVPAFTPTKAFANPMLTFLPLPKFLNKLSYKFINAMVGMVNTPVKNFKKKHNLPKSNSLLDSPIIYGISPVFLERPKDFPSDHYFTGFWIKEPAREKLLEKPLEDFMSGQKNVLIITFGSMPYQSEIVINDFIKAILDKFDVQILIVKAWGLKDVSINQSENVMAIDSAPFDVLFPKANCVIHHGGAGTTAIALRSGIPQFICPVLHPVGDQYFWGKQTEKMGVGVHPIPLKKLSIPQVLAAVQQMTQGEMKMAAKKLSEKIKAENGLAKAKEIIEDRCLQIKDCKEMA